jgi:hypothetical protein
LRITQWLAGQVPNRAILHERSRLAHGEAEGICPLLVHYLDQLVESCQYRLSREGG